MKSNTIQYIFSYEFTDLDFETELGNKKLPFDRLVKVKSESKYTVLVGTPVVNKEYTRGACLLAAKSLGSLLTAAIVHEDGSEEVLYDSARFTKQTIPGELSKDILNLISSQLTKNERSNLRQLTKDYSQKMSPTKRNLKTKGISSALYESLREYYSPQEIFELFLFFPDVAETCVIEDKSLLGDDEIGDLKLWSMVKRRPLHHCTAEKADETRAMLIVNRGEEMSYLHDSAVLDRITGQKILPLASTLPPEKQWTILKNVTDLSVVKQLIEVYGFNIFSLNGKNILNDRTFPEEIVRYLSTVDGIEKDFDPPMFIRNTHFPISNSMKHLLLNPLLYPEPLIIKLLKKLPISRRKKLYTSIIDINLYCCS